MDHFRDTMRPMNILEQSITAANGVSELARVLELEPNVVSNWRKRGIPESWAKVLLLMQRHRDGVFSGHVTNVSALGARVLANSHEVQ